MPAPTAVGLTLYDFLLLELFSGVADMGEHDVEIVAALAASPVISTAVGFDKLSGKLLSVQLDPNPQVHVH